MIFVTFFHVRNIDTGLANIPASIQQKSPSKTPSIEQDDSILQTYFANIVCAVLSMMKSILFLSSSPQPSSSPPPQVPMPLSRQEPTTSSRDNNFSEDNSSSEYHSFSEDNYSSEDNISKPSSKNKPKELKYLEVPQNPSPFFRFLVYAAGGTLPSTVKKVTRKAPKGQNRIFDCSFSRHRTQYSWVVQPQCHKKRRGNKKPPKQQAKQMGTDDRASHEEDAHGETICEKMIPEKYSQKSVTFDFSVNPPPTPPPKGKSRVSTPLPSALKRASCALATPGPSHDNQDALLSHGESKNKSLGFSSRRARTRP